MLGWLWPNDTVVAVVKEITLLRTTTPPLATWDDLLPDQATHLPTELARIDAYLDDERFLAPWRCTSTPGWAAPRSPIPTLLRLLYLKHRYRSATRACKEVGDSISWRRFCRIPLDQPRPPPHHPEQAGPPRRPRCDRAAQLRPARQARRRQATARPQAAGRHHRGRRERGLPHRCGTAGAGDRQAGRHQQAGAGRRGRSTDHNPGSSPRGSPPGAGGRPGAAVAQRCRQAARLRGDQAGRRPGRRPAWRRPDGQGGDGAT